MSEGLGWPWGPQPPEAGKVLVPPGSSSGPGGPCPSEAAGTQLRGRWTLVDFISCGDRVAEAYTSVGDPVHSVPNGSPLALHSAYFDVSGRVKLPVFSNGTVAFRAFRNLGAVLRWALTPRAAEILGASKAAHELSFEPDHLQVTELYSRTRADWRRADAEVWRRLPDVRKGSAPTASRRSVGPSSLSELSPFEASGPPPSLIEISTTPTHSAVAAASSENDSLGPDCTEDTSVGRLPYRWWRDRSKECVEKKRERGEAGKKWLDREARILERFPGDIWRRVGITSPPSSGSHVTRGQVIALRDADPSIFRGTTRSQYLQALREYLRFEGNPIANERVLWSVDTSDVRRRWLTRAQLGLLWSVCRDGKDRLIVAMLGFNGLRRIELLRLRVRDLTLVADVPRAHVLGKGRGSGKWREIPLSSLAYGALVETSTGRSADARVYPGERTDVDHRLSELGERAGIPVRVSSHDLRRSFGRVAYYSGVPLVDLQHIYGHASPTMTAHYIGIDLAEMAAGLALFDKAMRPSLATPESRGG